ncbi:MAG: 3-isopropylmalate dehydratase large subunit [Nitrososphaerota archaeon]|nr:3-isopropylmalate dehydratase large subunit [Nitrososphaerota archaeon]MDG6940023.1 3-isopropylmalate dehydratase large subunit [Nitrososphaerota archaeon]
MGATIFDKVWDRHLLSDSPDGQSLIYVDRHLVHEVTSPVAFEGLKAAGRKVRRPDLTFAVMDHNVPTGDRSDPNPDDLSVRQMGTLKANAVGSQIALLDIFNPLQGIVHVIGPELGFTIPGTTLVCGDSHTTTHGALGAVAFGIGTTEVEHVLATQSIWMAKPKQMAVRTRGALPRGVCSKDLALWVIRNIGTGGAFGHVMEYKGETVERMSVEERMTLANMAVEAGARSAIMSPDEKVYDYVRGKPFAPQGRDWEEAMEYWDTLPSDPSAAYDRSVEFDAGRLEPQVTWGTNPGMTVGVTEAIPGPEDFEDGGARAAVGRSLRYIGLAPHTRVKDIEVDVVFIGSCTNARFSDLVQAARVVAGSHMKVHPSVKAMVVPGSQSVRRRAEEAGLDKIFRDAGFDWRNSGCSMCIAMNEDRVPSGKRCASTSNRNFENRQGPGGRTHLVSPVMAAAAALHGRFVDARELDLADVGE